MTDSVHTYLFPQHLSFKQANVERSGVLPVQLYFYPVQRDFALLHGKVTGTEGLEGIALADPDRTMGKAWLHAVPRAQPADGLSRAIAYLNCNRGLRRRAVASLPRPSGVNLAKVVMSAQPRRLEGPREQALASPRKTQCMRCCMLSQHLCA